MNDNNVMIYQDENGITKVSVRFSDEDIWVTQQQLAEVYDTTQQNISQHIDGIYKDGELAPEATNKKFLLVRTEGNRQVRRNIDHYNLDMIIAIGYRVQSQIATRFRRWATERLHEYIQKGFTMDDDRLKQGGSRYFRELLQRIRDIRSSERNFYQQVTDIYATAMDYDPRSDLTRAFFATVQNKLHYAVHEHTAAEVIYDRVDSEKPLVGMTNFKGDYVTKDDVKIAKNYLSEIELQRLNLLVAQFLDFAELQALEQIPMTMQNWIDALDNAALAVLLTSRGIPTIYYGTEQYVIPGDASDVAGRVYMPTECGFSTTTTAYQLIATLSTLRRSNDAIAYGTTTVRYSDDNVMVFERQFYDDVVVVAVNRQPDSASVIPAIQTNLPTGQYADYLDGSLFGTATTVQNNLIPSFTISGGGVCVWQYQASEAPSTPQIGDVISTTGRPGNTVHIYGDGFSGNISVYFGTIAATVQSTTANKIVATVPEGVIAGLQPITVRKGTATSNAIYYNVLSGDQNQIVFHVSAETQLGENIYIVGNIPELGNWNPDNCTESMLNPNYPEWFLPVSVPSGTTIEFKFIKKDALGNITWESGSNRTVTSSSNPCGVVDTEVYTWRN